STIRLHPSTIWYRTGESYSDQTGDSYSDAIGESYADATGEFQTVIDTSVGFYEIPDLHKILAIIKGSSAQGERKDLDSAPTYFTGPPVVRPIPLLSGVRLRMSVVAAGRRCERE
ncbi:MAG: hypothetical protein Q7V05_02030, partial [Methanoregula sp.]|nr:hypothetical protein [Methanoregula sp.]